MFNVQCLMFNVQCAMCDGTMFNLIRFEQFVGINCNLRGD